MKLIPLRIGLILLIILFALISFGCSGSGDQISDHDIYRFYNSLNMRHTEISDHYEALQNKEITKFNWRIIADSSKKSSQRVLDSLEDSDHPYTDEIREIAEAQLEFTDHMIQNVDHNGKLDWSYRDAVKTKLDAIRPEMEQIRAEIEKTL